MTSILVKGGADFSANAVGWRAPVQPGLVMWLLIGGKAGDTTAQKNARSTKNLAFTSNSAVIIGTPTINTGYGSLNFTNYIQTDAPETASFSLLAVARNTDTLASNAHQPGLIATAGITTVANGAGIHWLFGSAAAAPPARLASYVSVGTPPSATTVVTNGANLPNASSQFEFVYLTADNTAGTISMGSKSESLVTPGSFTAGTRCLNAAGSTWRVGAEYATSTAGGQADFAMAAIYNRALSAAEITTCYAFMQTYMSLNYSIPI